MLVVHFAIGHNYNIPMMQLFTRISKNTQAKYFML